MKRMGPLMGLLLIFSGCMLVSPQWAGATQVHPPAEGLYVHQMAHVFFALSMGTLIYWLREHKLIHNAGWRYVQYGAFFFILWNVDAMVAHYLESPSDLGDHFEMINAGSWHARIQLISGIDSTPLLYYLVRLDHILTIPGIVFLYIGLRHLLKQAQSTKQEEGGS